MSGEITWIKVAVSTFGGDSMKLIQSLPDGDAITVIWFRLLMQAGKCNAGGYIRTNNGRPLSLQQLATLFDRPWTIMEFAMRTFVEFEMVEETDSGFFIVNWEKYQNVEGMDKVREQNRIRQQRRRERLSLNAPKSVPSNVTNNVTSNVTVTQSHATDKDQEVDPDQEIDQRTTTESSSSLSFDDDLDVDSPKEQFKRLVAAYESDGFGPLTHTVGEQLEEFREEFGVEWTLQAMREAILSNKRSLRYVRGILQNWKRNGGPEEREQQQDTTSQKNERDPRYSKFYQLFPDQ